MARIFLWMQVAFSVLILIGAAGMLIRSMMLGSDAIVVLCLAGIVAAAWRLMVKPSIAELNAEKGAQE